MVAKNFLCSIPSPDNGVWHLGPLPIRAYGIAILVGIIFALIASQKRYASRGGNPEVLLDLAVLVVPAGIIGGRLYHVITSWQLYFGKNGNPWETWKIWHGGLGIWGAVLTGTLVACLFMRKRKLAIAPLADAIAPTLLVAQAIGRLGNYFNQELFGAPTNLPWGLEIAAAHRPAGFSNVVTYHPTFLYEMIWNLLIAALLIYYQRNWQQFGGELFALYICGYTLGRGWIEYLRIDDANLIFGLRLNVWTSILVFFFGLALFKHCRQSGYKKRVGSGRKKIAR